MMKSSVSWWIIVPVILSVMPCSAGFRIQQIGRQSDYIDSVPSGIGIDPDGRLSLAGTLSSVWVSETDSAAWTIAVDGLIIYIATAQDGKVYRHTNNSTDIWFDSPQTAILSLLPLPSGKLLAGSAPDGIIYAVDDRGTASVFSRTNTAYIWKMLHLKKNEYLVATGLPASILRLDRTGAVIQTLEINATHVRTMVQDSEGSIWIGTAEPARIYCLKGDDLQLVHEAGGAEISAMATGTNGIWFATVASAAITDSRNEQAQKLLPRKPDPAQPAEQNSVWFMNRERSVYEIWSTVSVPVFDLIAIDDTPYLVCGADGLLVRIDGVGRSTLLATRNREPLVSLARDASGIIWAGGALNAELLRFNPEPGKSGTIESSVMDAGSSAVWGRLLLQGQDLTDKTVSVQSRTGNTAEPDDEWSDWAETGQNGHIGSPPARHFQWKMTLQRDQKENPVVDTVSVSFKTANRSPYVRTVTVHPVVKGEFVEQPGRGRSFQQTMPDGLRVEYFLPAANYNNLSKGTWMQLRGMRTVSWDAGDPDSDPLEFHVEVSPASGTPKWFSIAKNITQPLVSFDSTAYADGLYRVRVLASDSPANPHNEGLTAECRSLVFEIDNTPPVIKDINVTRQAAESNRGGSITISGRAVDNGRRISRLEFSRDTQTWFAFTSADGMLDESTEWFELDLKASPAEPVPHQIFLRVTDDQENVSTSTVVILHDSL